MKYFFLVADWGAQNYLVVPNVMFSAGSIADVTGRKWLKHRIRLPEGTAERVILDSGGFAFFSRWGEYPFSIDEYISLYYQMSETLPMYSIATLDYPCEPSVNRKNLKTNKERIDKTVSNAAACIDRDPRLPWLPVIQGHYLEEYLYCIDQYKEVGIKNEYWAIGSVCTRKGFPFELRRIITRVKQAIGDQRLHAFGLGRPYLKDPQIFQAIFSSDSAAWNFWIAGENVRERKKKAAIEYHSSILNMIEMYEGQTKLGDYFG